MIFECGDYKYTFYWTFLFCSSNFVRTIMLQSTKCKTLATVGEEWAKGKE